MNKNRYRKIVLIYLLTGVLWIIGSDWVLAQFFGDFENTYMISMLKGLGFVGLMSALLYVLLMRLNNAEHKARINESPEQLFLSRIPNYFSAIPIITYAMEVREHKALPLWISENLSDVLGYSQEEASSPHWWQNSIHPDDRLRAIEESKAIITRGGGDHYYRVKHARGHYVYFHDELRLIPDTNPPRFIGIWRDVSTEEKALEQVQEYSSKLEKMVLGTVTAISHMVELRDPYTAGHEARVGDLAAEIAREMGLDIDTQYGLRIAGLVHDIGKISVPSEYLTKPTRLTVSEFEIIKTHASNGYSILKNIDFPWPIAEVAYQHHERINGSGYPRGLSGDEILLEAKIIAVADVIESMATNRPYRHAQGIDKALDEIRRNQGILYDTHVCEAALKLFKQQGYQLAG